MALPGGRRLHALTLLERDDLERDAEDLRDLLAELPLLGEVVARPTQPAPDDLLAEQLRHERAQPDDVRDRVAVPALGEHPDADDAAHVAARRMQRPVELLRQLLEPLRIDRPPLRVCRPLALPDGVEREPHPAVLVVLRPLDLRLSDHLRVDPDRVDAPVLVPQLGNVGRRDPRPAASPRRSTRRSHPRAACSCRRG